MSKVSIKGNASGTGNFTIEAPNSNTDRTLNLPDEAGTLATVENLPAGYTDTDALDLFNATGSAPVYACRAWANFGSQNTMAGSIDNSGNVSSITDNGTGDFTVNLTTALPFNNYSVLTSGKENDDTRSVSECQYLVFEILTGSFRIFAQEEGAKENETEVICVAAFA